MRDPRERIEQFVRQQQQQAIFEHARAVWVRRTPEMAVRLGGILDAFKSGLAADSVPNVHVLASPRRVDGPLVLAFERRRTVGDAMEAGANCVFRCDADGLVYGYRYPFHDELRDVRPERFVDLGEPEWITGNQVANAAADFLEWAAIGAGCGSRRLSFWSPPVTLPMSVAPTRLRLAA